MSAHVAFWWEDDKPTDLPCGQMNRPEREILASEGRRLFGLDPAGYASGRPGYPERIFDVLVERCGLADGTPTLEIGPGAGQATAELLVRGARPLVAVEPDPAFAEFLVNRFQKRVDVVQQPFEEADLPDDGFALAASATAFHWVEQKRGLANLARVLRSDGWLAAWWMAHYDPGAPDALFHALTPIFKELPTPPGTRRDDGTVVVTFPFDREARIADLSRAGAFHRISVEEVRSNLALDPPRARALFSTFSSVLALNEPEQESVLDRIERVVAEQFGGAVERTCVTILYTAQRI